MKERVSLEMILPTNTEVQFQAATVDIYKNKKEFLLTDFKLNFSNLGDNIDDVFAKTEASATMLRKEVGQCDIHSSK